MSASNAISMHRNEVRKKRENLEDGRNRIPVPRTIGLKGME